MRDETPPYVWYRPLTLRACVRRCTPQEHPELEGALTMNTVQPLVLQLKWLRAREATWLPSRMQPAHGAGAENPSPRFPARSAFQIKKQIRALSICMDVVSLAQAMESNNLGLSPAPLLNSQATQASYVPSVQQFPHLQNKDYNTSYFVQLL